MIICLLLFIGFSVFQKANQTASDYRNAAIERYEELLDALEK